MAANLKYKSGNSWFSYNDVIYPVGAVYLATSNTSPANLFGGTWTKKTSGVLVCAGTTGYASVGNSSGSSTISIQNMPSHQHTMSVYSTDGTGDKTGAWELYIGDRWSEVGAVRSAKGVEVDARWNATGFGPTALAGGGTAYYPLHYSVNVWVRTA